MKYRKDHNRGKNNFFWIILNKIENLFDPTFDFWYDYTLGDNDIIH